MNEKMIIFDPIGELKKMAKKVNETKNKNQDEKKKKDERK